MSWLGTYRYICPKCGLEIPDTESSKRVEKYDYENKTNTNDLYHEWCGEEVEAEEYAQAGERGHGKQ